VKNKAGFLEAITLLYIALSNRVRRVSKTDGTLWLLVDYCG
jgi:hypothetical protein